MTGENADGPLECAEAGNPVETRLAGRNHLMCGSLTVASMSSRALANNIIDPAAADEASHADFSSPDITAWRRVLIAFSARLRALWSKAFAAFSSSGTDVTERRLELSRRRSLSDTSTVGSD